MQFDPEALQNKMRYLDAVLTAPKMVECVVAQHISGKFRLVQLPRVWEPGGGATLFRIESSEGPLLLKIKHQSVFVESRLESEPQFLHVSSLSNEHKFLQLLNKSGTNWVPHISFFDSMDSFEFLAVEWLETFERTVANLTAFELLESWDQLQKAAQQLFEQGIVHTDIHEHNLCFRGKQIVLIDFEEARFLKQNLPFEQSLDVIGENCYGNVGDFPATDGAIPGLTCLIRLKGVYKNLIRQRLPVLIERCNFDQNCLYNLDTMQESDSRIYQSLNFGNLKIVGQRPLDDRRLGMLKFLLKRFPRIHPINHLDIGSNLGMFCFKLSKLKFVRRSVGVEASQEYVNTSQALAFLYDQEKTDFYQLVCGESSVADIFADANVVTMFSVYHHIAKKDRFLDDLCRLNAKYLIAEFATQDRFYPERGSLHAEIRYIQKCLGFPFAHTLAISKDYNRPIILFSDTPLDLLTKIGFKWSSRGGWKWILEHVRHPIASCRSAIGRWPVMNHLLIRLKHSWYSNQQSTNSQVIGHTAARQWIAAQSVSGAGIRVYANGKYSYPEVTGYYIPTLLDWGERDRAIQYAQWLLSIQNADGSWSDPSGKTPYTFDTGQVLKGLIAILPRLPEVEHAIRRGCDWLLTQVEPNGEVTTPDASAWRLPGGKSVSDNIHLYALEPLRKAGELFDEPNYTEAVEHVLAHYLAKPDLTEFNTLSHFHAYVLEALVDLGYPDVATRGMAEVERLQRKDGSVPAYPDVDWVCSTGLAQYAVIWYKLGQREPAERAFNYLCRIQNHSGGFYGSYGRGANYFPKEEISWAVKFFLDAHYWHIKTSFNEEIDKFPDSIDESDGRNQEILSFFGDLNGKKVIDIGCGKGRFLRVLKSKFPNAQLYGLDISEEMLSFCPDGIETKCGGLLDIRYPDDYFDCVYCVEALEHALRTESAIKEMVRILKPGGKIIIIDKDIAKLGSLKLEPWEQWFKPEEVIELLQKYGVEAHYKPIAYGEHKQPDGLFIAWEGVKNA